MQNAQQLRPTLPTIAASEKTGIDMVGVLLGLSLMIMLALCIGCC